MRTVSTCVECGHKTVEYRRGIHREMVRFLAALRRAGLGTLVDVRSLDPATAKASTDACYFVHWGFVERPSRGLYAITQAGIDFLNGATAHKSVITRNGCVVGFEGEVTVDDVKGFDPATDL